MVEEDQYRSTYRAINERRCVFEKAVLTRRCHCSCSTRFYLADREGISCNARPAHARCQQLLEQLRQNARFALRLGAPAIESGKPLPHAKEIKVQNGGLLGLQRLLEPEAPTGTVTDIARLAVKGIQTWGDIESFPYTEIVQSIVHFEGRRRRGDRG
ncbi:MAG TPA: hypothetical protein ENJ79_07345 [Gammaproteobacteria bacterium]|nr:hypothetical protein [Gammaproteobacteria bacterium]